MSYIRKDKWRTFYKGGKKASFEQNVIDRLRNPISWELLFPVIPLKKNNWSPLGNFSPSYLFSANEMSLICSGMLGEWAIWLATRNLMMYTKCVRTASSLIFFLCTNTFVDKLFQSSLPFHEGFTLKLEVMNRF